MTRIVSLVLCTCAALLLLAGPASAGLPVPNRAPTCSTPAAASVISGHSVTSTVSCSDADGDALTYAVGSGPSHGTVTHNGPAFTYTPATGYTGGDSLTVTANDGQATSSPVTLSVTVAADHAPSCGPAQMTVQQGDSGAVNLACSDADGDAITFSLVSAPSKGTATVSSTGLVSYRANADATGTDTLTFGASDGIAAPTTGTVAITITQPNRAPTCSAAQTSVRQGGTGVVNVSCTDADGDPLTYAIASGPAHGTASISPSGAVTISPSASYTGADSLTFTARDGQATSAPATLSITVTRENHAPVCSDAQLTAHQGGTGVVNAYCSDADGDPLTYAIASGPSHGTASISSSGAITVHPAADYTGADSLTFTTSDGTATSAPATLSITVKAEHAPSCPDATFSEVAGHRRQAFLQCTDADGDALTYVKVSSPAHGTADLYPTNDGRGLLSLLADSGYMGTDSFTYRASDGDLSSPAATVTLDVGPNHAPVCRNQTTLARPGQLDVFAPECSDPDGDSLRLNVVSQGTKGTASNGYSFLTYQANDDFAGTDSFTFQASDGDLSSDVTTVTVTADAPHGPDCVDHGGDPSGQGDTVEDDGTAHRVYLHCAPGDDGLPLTFVIDRAPAHGTLASQGGNSYSTTYGYTVTSGFRGTDSFTYHAEGPRGYRSESETYTLTVNARQANHPPQDCYGLGYQPRVRTGHVLHATVSCSDPDGDALSAEVVDAPDHGTLTFGSASTQGIPVSYEPHPNFSGVDHVEIRLRDPQGAAGPVLATDIQVEPASANRAPGPCLAPSAHDERIEPGQTAVIDHLCGDPDGDELTYRVTAPPLHGTLTQTSPGVFSYVPAAGFTGYDSFLYKASDGDIEIKEQTRQISVGVDPNAGDAPPRTGEPGGAEPSPPFSNVPPGASSGSGGGGGGGGGSSSAKQDDPADAPASSAPQGSAPTPSQPTQASRPVTPTTTQAPSTTRSAGLDLGDATAAFVPGVSHNTVELGSAPTVPVLDVGCIDACAVRSTPTLTLGASGRGASAAKARTIHLTSTLLQLKAGKHATVTVRLSAAQRKLVRQAGSAVLTISLRVRHADGTTKTDTVRLHLRASAR